MEYKALAGVKPGWHFCTLKLDSTKKFCMVYTRETNNFIGKTECPVNVREIFRKHKFKKAIDYQCYIDRDGKINLIKDLEELYYETI